MNPVFFSAYADFRHMKDLENLLFFNKNQKIYSKQIEKSVTRFGYPRIVLDEKRLRVEIEGIEGTQNLFIFDGEGDDASLLGVLIYYRQSMEKITILHIAVVEDCSANGKYAKEFITLRLINRLKEDSAKIKGIELLSFAYRTNTDELSNIPIKHKA